MSPMPPPHDPALPAIGELLDPARAIDLLSGALATDQHRSVVSAQPVYVRYKPETSCLIEYALGVRQANGSLMTVPAFAWVYADGRGARRWASDSLQRLLARADRRHPAFPCRRAAYLPVQRALLQVFPVDLDLPALVRATSPTKVSRLVDEHLPPTAGEVRRTPPELVRYKPGRKALLRLAMTGGDLTGIYAKLHADDRGEFLFAAGRALHAAGFPTPLPLAYLPDLQLIVHPKARGDQLATLRATPRFTEAMEPVAATLARLHEIEIAGLTVGGRGELTSDLTATASLLARLLPRLATPIRRLTDTLVERLAALAEERTTVHGDFYDDQVLVAGGEVTIIDLDELRRGHPLQDAGNFLAHLAVAEVRHGSVLGGAMDAFREAIRRRRADAASTLSLLEAAGLLRLAVGPFRRVEADWPDRVEAILRLAETRLGTAAVTFAPTPDASPKPRVEDDPALPQLTALRDPERMASLLSAHLGAATEIRAITPVRHKPGRRAILRYDAQVHGRTTRLYAKTFASERGPRVYRTIAAIATARACGPDIAIPEPIGFLPELKLLLQRAVAGDPIRPALLDGDRALAGRIAEAIHRFHRSDVELERWHSLERELEPLVERTARLAESCPALGRPAATCLEQVQRGRSRTWAWRRRPIHRDFYHDQILRDATGCLAFLDFDDAAMGEPAVDVANFAAHLRLLAIQERDDPEALAPVVDAFLTQALALDADLNPRLVRFLEGATLLRLAEIHLPRQNGEVVAAHLIRESERLLGTALAPASIAETPAIPAVGPWPADRARPATHPLTD